MRTSKQQAGGDGVRWNHGQSCRWARRGGDQSGEDKPRMIEMATQTSLPPCLPSPMRSLWRDKTKTKVG